MVTYSSNEIGKLFQSEKSIANLISSINYTENTNIMKILQDYINEIDYDV